MKKYAIANLTAPTIAAILDGNDPKLAGSMALLAILLYSLQQYADFSGGIDMVLGVAQLYGIEMMPNFRQPYFSTSLGISGGAGIFRWVRGCVITCSIPLH